ncbi:MAG: DNA polymerase III subunit alpha, partial [Planctomycetes bacterium]|nr:DNA polymerase III subunit alpha [Planctomycetota bacterium]
AALADFSLNEADSLRKAMGKKKPEILAKFKKKFVDGAAQTHQVEAAVSTEIWEQIEYFAGYGFNKSHSAAYALVTYQTAWFKANHPIEYMAALLSCEMISIDKTVEYIDECRAMDIEILSPDVNHSYFEFEVEDSKIRYALGAIRGAGRQPVDLLCAERNREARPFNGLYELCERVDTRTLNKGVLEALIHAGALDALEGNRAQKLAIVEEALRLGQDAQKDLRSGQMSLFGVEELEEVAASNAAARLPDIPELPEAERLQLEKAALGFYLSGHPLNEFREPILRFASHQIADLGFAPDNAEVTVGGIVRSVRLMLTKRGKWEGKRMAFVKLEDFSGTADCVVFASIYAEFSELIKPDAILFLRGEVNRQRSEPSLKVNVVIPLDQARTNLTKRLTLRVSAGVSEDLEMTIVALKRMLKENPGRVPVAFEIATPDFGRVTVQAGNEYSVTASETFFRQAESVLGERGLYFN